MRLVFVITILLAWFPAFAQKPLYINREIDHEVKRIDSDSSAKSVTFSIQAMKKVLHFITYTYKENKSGYIKISRQFSQRSDTTRQTFYLRKGELIFATEKVVSFYTENNLTDSITWNGDFYFLKGRLIDHVTLGHGKSELDSWNPEQDVLNAYIESKKDIARFRKNKSGG